MKNSLKVKVFSFVGIPLFLIIILIGITITTINIQNNNKTIKLFEKTVYDEKKELIKNEVLTLASIIEGIIKNNPNIKIAKEKAIEVANHARFLNNAGYFFAYEKKEMISIMVFMVQNHN